MRFGGPVFTEYSDPDAWIAALEQYGYSAAYCPVDASAGRDVVRAYAEAAARAGIVIAEVGAWSNPLDPDEQARHTALAKCREQLALADEIGARCCVNIAGSRGDIWDGHHPANLTRDTFDLIVETVRAVVDDVKPTRTFYTLEPMPWMYPDSADNYLALIKAVGRDRFAAHLDPVNLVVSPKTYYENGTLLHELFSKLGPYIKSCHAKDVVMAQKLTVHLDEVRPGEGWLDYGVFLTELNRLEPDTPLMLEHLHTGEEYQLAAEYVRRKAAEIGVIL